jgi:hypothetical protein
MGWGNEERGYSYMKNLTKGYGREKRLRTAALVNELDLTVSNGVIFTQPMVNSVGRPLCFLGGSLYHIPFTASVCTQLQR